MVNGEGLRTGVVSLTKHFITGRSFISIPLWTSYERICVSFLCVIHPETMDDRFPDGCAFYSTLELTTEFPPKERRSLKSRVENRRAFVLKRRAEKLFIS
jgi:hypothetical protein